MLLIDAYEFTPVQGPCFTGRKVTLVGLFIKLQSVHVDVVFPYFYIISFTQRKSRVTVNLVPRALFTGFGGGAGKAREKRPGDEVGVTVVFSNLCTCVQISNASLRDFLAQNSWTTLSVSMLVDARQCLCPCKQIEARFHRTSLLA